MEKQTQKHLMTASGICLFASLAVGRLIKHTVRRLLPASRQISVMWLPAKDGPALVRLKRRFSLNKNSMDTTPFWLDMVWPETVRVVLLLLGIIGLGFSALAYLLNRPEE